MKQLQPDPTIEIETEYLIPHLLTLAKEVGEWEILTPENIHDEDEPWREVRAANVDSIDHRKEGVIEITGSFDSAVITDRIRGTHWHPPEVRTADAEGHFHVRYYMEDLGHAEGTIEVY